MIVRMSGVLCNNITRKEGKNKTRGKGKQQNENRVECKHDYDVCSCNLRRGREVAEDLQCCEPPGKG